MHESDSSTKINEWIKGHEPATPAQAEIRDRIEAVKRKRQAIAEVVKCQACGVLVPVPAGSCYVCPNCGFNSGACG